MADLIYGTNLLTSSLAKNVSELADEYGQNIWTNAYEDAVKPYEQQYAQSVNAYDLASKELKQDYSDAINKAYEQYVYNKRATEFSNLGTGDQSMFSEVYRKAYDKNKQQYYKDYLSAQGTLDAQLGKATESYETALYNIMQNIAGEQSSIATNSADTLNMIYNYVYDELFTQYKDDEYVFGPTSPLYGLINGKGEFVNPSDFLDMFSQIGEDGQRILTNDFEQLIKFINNIESVKELDETTGKEYRKYGEGFGGYMLSKNKDLFEWYSQNRDLLYKDLLGIDNYDYYNPKDYKYADTLSSSDIGSSYDFKTGDKIENETLIDTLNALKQGDGKQQVVYRGDVYSYDDGTWKKVKDENAYERIQLDKNGEVEINGKQVTLASNAELTLGLRSDNEKQDPSLPFGTSNHVVYENKEYTVQSNLPNDTKKILNSLGDKQRVVRIDGRLYAYVKYTWLSSDKSITIGQGALKNIRYRNGQYYDTVNGGVLTEAEVRALAEEGRIQHSYKWVELT